MCGYIQGDGEPFVGISISSERTATLAERAYITISSDKEIEVEKWTGGKGKWQTESRY